jgi:hypothetical protein
MSTLKLLPLRLSLLAAGLLVSVSCTYAPEIENGKLLCGASDACPKGYTCRGGQSCWKEGSSTGVTRANLLGDWPFTTGTLTISCSDNTSQMKALAGPKDYIQINAGPNEAIVGSYYCDWVLDLAIVAGHATTTVRPAQSCTTSSGGTDFTWTATTFLFTSNDGATGALNSTIQATYKDATGTGTCKLVVMGNLQKTP